MKRVLTALLFAAGAVWAASPEQFQTSVGTLQLTPIQHASLMIQAGGKVLYIDPAQGKYEGLPQADYILITHGHSDHIAGNAAHLLKPYLPPRNRKPRLPDIYEML